MDLGRRKEGGRNGEREGKRKGGEREGQGRGGGKEGKGKGWPPNSRPGSAIEHASNAPPLPGADVRYLSRQPDTSLHCMTA